MLWWSGAFEPANIIILSICGALAGYFWYRAMRWQFQLMGMLPRNDSAGTNAKCIGRVSCSACHPARSSHEDSRQPDPAA